MTLKDWYLCSVMGEKMIARGIVYGHYRLEDGEDIHTSTIEKFYAIEDGKYYLETASGSLYELIAEEMKPEMKKDSIQLIEKINVVYVKDHNTKTELEWKKCQCDAKRNYRDETLRNAAAWAKDNLKDKELYVLMEGEYVIKAYYREENLVREIKPTVHIGLFTDSILITDWEQNKVDFRYVPRGMKIKPYHWSNGLEGVYIHNLGDEDALFVGTAKDIICLTNEIVKIEKDVYKGDGLLSPDVCDKA